ncbi:MAG TPA: hypothetical protein VHY83_04385 [Solirubrobacteraceae bacterium]|jgi:hypothetical protein|nr:hypothetical protein [Solirubrobacteraceae bacterium]
MSIEAKPLPHPTLPIESGSRLPSRSARWLALATAAACVLLLAAELASGWNVLHSSGFFSALAARKYVWANTLGAILIALLALAAPRRWRWLAVLGPGLYLLAILGATAILGGKALAMIVALMTMAALWDTGERLLRRLGVQELSRNVLVAWLAGIAPWSLGTLALGRLSLIKWWTVGILLVLFGTIGILRLTPRIVARRRSIAHELGKSPVNIAAAGLILFVLGWAAIYTAAPELQFDALYAKVYLPELWAHTGHIGSIAQHVQFEITGWFQLLTTGGHVLGADAIGRYLQLLGLVCAAAAIWWWGHLHGVLGPLAALAVVVTPQIFWQASTADDDVLLALAALAFCVAVVDSLRASERRNDRGLAFALGLMAGSGPSLKLHLTFLFAFLLIGWIAAGQTMRRIARRLGYAALGAAITALPPLVLRWIDTGNPLLPAYNNIFRSKYWPPVNEQANFPFWRDAGTLGPVEAAWKAVVEPKLMAEAAAPGAFGVFVGAIVVALLLGWLGRRRVRGSAVIWWALLPTVVVWWVSLRYLRYLLPAGLVSIALILMLTSGVRLGPRGRILSVVGATLAVIATFPVTISLFWNVPTHKPPVYAAIGKWSASSYEDAALTERPAILAFNRLSPPGSRMATTAYERVWLTGGRDLYALGYDVPGLLDLQGPLPTSGDATLGELRQLGIDWVLVTGPERLLNEPGFLSQVLTLHGQPEFGERGWDLYRLVGSPPPPRPLSTCDVNVRGVASCWGGTRAADGHLTSVVARTLVVCAGETLGLSITQAPSGAPSPVLIRFIGGSPTDGIQPGEAVPGAPQRIFATAPQGATRAEVIISPGAGAQIRSARLDAVGTTCASHSSTTR